MVRTLHELSVISLVKSLTSTDTDLVDSCLNRHETCSTLLVKLEESSRYVKILRLF